MMPRIDIEKYIYVSMILHYAVRIKSNVPHDHPPGEISCLAHQYTFSPDGFILVQTTTIVNKVTICNNDAVSPSISCIFDYWAYIIIHY